MNNAGYLPESPMLRCRVPLHSRRSQLLKDAVAALVLLVFFYTALSKLVTYSLFVFVMGQSSLLAPFAGVLAWAIPATELMLCVLLFLPRTRRVGLYLSGLLMLLFTGYLVYMLGVDSSERICNCGGVLNILSWKAHLVVNIILLVFIVAALWFSRSGAENSGRSPPGCYKRRMSAVFPIF